MLEVCLRSLPLFLADSEKHWPQRGAVAAQHEELSATWRARLAVGGTNPPAVIVVSCSDYRDLADSYDVERWVTVRCRSAVDSNHALLPE